MDSRDSQLLGRMAEVQLALGHWARAEGFAERARAAAGNSADQCRRSWRMVALAREGAGDMKGAVRAWNEAEACPEAPGTASGGGRGSWPERCNWRAHLKRTAPSPGFCLPSGPGPVSRRWPAQLRNA